MSDHSDQMDYDDNPTLNRSFTIRTDDEPPANLGDMDPMLIGRNVEPKQFGYQDVTSKLRCRRSNRTQSFGRNLTAKEENRPLGDVHGAPPDGDDDSPMSNYPRSDAPSIDCQNFSIESRIVLYSKHRDQLDSWKYSEEERASLRHKVESLSREQGILHCILGHMLHLPDEMIGTRTDIPESDEARHALLALARGSHWSVMDLAHLFYFAEKLNMEACEKSFRGIPLLPSSHQVSKDYRRRIETHFARCLLED